MCIGLYPLARQTYMQYMVKQKEASVYAQGYIIPLVETSHGVYVGEKTIQTSPNELFQTIFPPELHIVGSVGAKTIQTLHWSTFPSLHPGPMERYTMAKDRLSPFMSFVEFSKYMYAGLFLFFSIALIISIVVEWKKQHHNIIAQSIGLLTLLLLFYFF
jgi:hypothetical protein